MGPSMNPMDLIGLIKGGYNPQQLVLTILQNNMQGNPMAQNLLALAQSGDTAQIEQIARNACREKGIDYDKEFNSFKRNLGL